MILIVHIFMNVNKLCLNQQAVDLYRETEEGADLYRETEEEADLYLSLIHI